MLTALMAGVVIPWGGKISYRRSFLSFTNNRHQHWSIICFFAVVSFGVYGIMIGRMGLPIINISLLGAFACFITDD
jgi:hypothetical protein